MRICLSFALVVFAFCMNSEDLQAQAPCNQCQAAPMVMQPTAPQRSSYYDPNSIGTSFGTYSPLTPQSTYYPPTGYYAGRPFNVGFWGLRARRNYYQTFYGPNVQPYGYSAPQGPAIAPF